jgi:hypothetical protein
MAVLDFPASPTVGQTATLTNGFTYQWDGAVWTLAAATGQAAGGDLSGTYPNPTVVKSAGNFTVGGTESIPGLGPNHLQYGGLGVTKGRLIGHPTIDGYHYLTENAALNAAATTWVQDDAAKPSWMFQLSSYVDNACLVRAAPGVASYLVPLTIDGTGKVTLPGSSTEFLAVLGAATCKTRLIESGGIWSGLAQNRHPGTGARDDPAKPSWEMLLRADTDAFEVRRTSPANAFTTPLVVRGSDGKTICTLDNNSVQRQMIAASHAVWQYSATAAPANYTCPAGAWTRYITGPTITTRGGLCMMIVSSALQMAGGAGSEAYVGLYNTGGWGNTAIRWTLTSNAPVGTLATVFWSGAGSIIPYIDIYAAANFLVTRADNPGNMFFIEFA